MKELTDEEIEKIKQNEIEQNKMFDELNHAVETMKVYKEEK